jgi:flagellar hook-length control protein FliK
MNNAAVNDLTVTRLTATSAPATGGGTAVASRAGSSPAADADNRASFSQALGDAAQPAENQAPGGAPLATDATPAPPAAAPQAPPAPRAAGSVARPAATEAELLLTDLNALQDAPAPTAAAAPAATAGTPGGDALPKDGTKLPQDPDPRAVLLALAQAIPTAAPAPSAASAPPMAAADTSSLPTTAARAATGDVAQAADTGQDGVRATASPTLAALLAGRTQVNAQDGGAIAGRAGAGTTAAGLDDEASGPTGLSPEKTAAAASAPADGFSRLLNAAGIFLQGAGGQPAAPPTLADNSALALAAAPMAQGRGLLASSDLSASALPTSTAAPAPLQPMANAATWAQNLGDRVLLLADQGTQQATLHLQPEHLGPLQIHIQLDDGTAQVSFSVHHPDTRAAVTDALPKLREMFNEQGLTLLQANVDSGGGRAGYLPDPARPWGPGTAPAVNPDDNRLAGATGATLWQVRPPGPHRIDLFV